MKLEHLRGRYLRLQRELAEAYEARPWHAGQIDRLVQQIGEAEREIAARAGGALTNVTMAPHQTGRAHS